MATTLYFQGTQPSKAGLLTRGRNDAKYAGGATRWLTRQLSTSRGGGAFADTAATVAGPTAGIETAGSAPYEYISPPVGVGFTLSGTITFNLRGFESSMNANATWRCVVERIDNTGVIISTVVDSLRTGATELGTSESAHNWTATPTSTTFAKGDRLRVRVLIDDASSNMGAGFSVSFMVAGTSSGASGDSFITLTETVTFEQPGTDSSGTVYYARDTASDIADQGVVEKAMSTTHGSSTVEKTSNTRAGFVSPPLTRYTDGAGGTALEWYTPRLNAFTLSGRVTVRTVNGDSAVNLFDFPWVEIAVVANDGTNVRVYGTVATASGSPNGSSGVTNDYPYVVGPDISVADGERIRVRFGHGDGNQAEVAGGTCTLAYDQDLTFGAASPVTGIQLTETVTEFVDVYVPRNPGVNYQDPGVFAVRRGATRRLWLPNLRPPRPALPCITTSTRKEGHGGLHDHQRQRPAARERQRWRRRRRCVLVQGWRDAHQHRAGDAARWGVVRAEERRGVREPGR